MSEADQDAIGRTLLCCSSAGAGFYVLAEVINAHHEAADLLCDRLQHIHQRLPDSVVVLLTAAAVAGASCQRVDQDQTQRQAKITHEHRLGLPGHSNELLK